MESTDLLDVFSEAVPGITWKRLSQTDVETNVDVGDSAVIATVSPGITLVGWKSEDKYSVTSLNHHKLPIEIITRPCPTNAVKLSLLSGFIWLSEQMADSLKLIQGGIQPCPVKNLEA